MYHRIVQIFGPRQYWNPMWVSERFWQQAFVPDDFTKATIASLYKTGEYDNPENYRPITLLNAVYKIYAYIIKNRITETLDEHTGETQFGFRKGKSTAEPHFLCPAFDWRRWTGTLTVMATFLRLREGFWQTRSRQGVCDPVQTQNAWKLDRDHKITIQNPFVSSFAQGSMQRLVSTKNRN